MVMKPSPIVEIDQGKIQGTTLTTRNGNIYYGYLGIPYAKPPQRFQPPQEPEKWEGIRDSSTSGARSLQRDSRTKKIEGSEDCLFLNVYTPKIDDKNSKIPVMVFIHGGAFSMGAGDQYGGKYLCDENVILVTINYRLGALGFLCTGDGLIKGNMGLKDQVMALKWVQKNVHAFGGDKTSVTLFGESAGSACVHYHILSQVSKGLFSAAIMQSGTALSPWARNKRPTVNAKRLGKLLGISSEDPKEFVNLMLEMDGRAIAAQSTNFAEHVSSELPIYFAPCVEDPSEDSMCTEPPYETLVSGIVPNPVPIIFGVNSDEGLYRALPIIRNPEKLAGLNQHWSIASQMVLIFSKDMIPNAEDFSTSAKNFYLGEGKLFSQETLKGLSNMVSDRLFNCATEASALLHAKVDNANQVFLYLFAYKGEYSMLNAFKIEEVLGVTHADELQYLMDQRVYKSKIVPNSEADLVSKNMVQLWTNFAKHGKPSRVGENSWKNVVPGESIEWYRIEDGVNDKMVSKPFGSRLEFWENLPWNQFLC